MVAQPVRKRPFVKAGKLASAGLLLGYARVSKGDDQNNVLQTLREVAAEIPARRAGAGQALDEAHEPDDD